jgi:hypothetical protein
MQPNHNPYDPTELFLNESVDLPLWRQMAKDIRTLEVSFDQRSVRDLVATYYRIQEDRIALAAQSRQLQKAGSPHEMVQYLSDNLKYMELALKEPLERFANTYVVGNWAMSQYGIGPVLAAGLIAHIDIAKAPTAGSIWRYAGYDPTRVWESGKKRPWNADLKVLCWKIGQSFMKFYNNDKCFYGKLYQQDKQRRQEANDAGQYADRAKTILDSKNWKANKSRSHLESGQLPPAQIDAQARRFAVKIFLSHFHAVWYEDYHSTLNGKPVRAPRPYMIEHGGHAHHIDIPHYVQAVTGETYGRLVVPE